MKVKFNKVLVLLLMAVISVNAFSFFGRSRGNTTMRLAENQPSNNPVTQSMEMFSELVSEKSNGEMKIDVYHSAQLGQETENIEQVQMSLIDFSRVNSVTLAQTVREMEVFTLPYIFDDIEHKFKVLDGEVGDEVLASLENYGMVGLGYLEAGTRNFYTTKPVETIEDLKGLKIRVQPSEVPIKMTQAIGAVPTPMNYGEVYSALQTGVIDGAENDFVSYHTSSHYEVAKNYILDGHLAPPALLIVSKAKFDAMSAEEQNILRESAKEAIKWQRKAMEDMQNESEKIVRESGVEVIEVNIKDFQDAVESIYDDYPQHREMIERIRSI